MVLVDIVYAITSIYARPFNIFSIP
jgi:hypothetical protein